MQWDLVHLCKQYQDWTGLKNSEYVILQDLISHRRWQYNCILGLMAKNEIHLNNWGGEKNIFFFPCLVTLNSLFNLFRKILPYIYLAERDHFLGTAIGSTCQEWLIMVQFATASRLMFHFCHCVKRHQWKSKL